MALTETTTTFEIVTLEAHGWTTDYVGAENTFPTIDEAIEAIHSLRALGGERAEAQYAIRETRMAYWAIYGTPTAPAEECPPEWQDRARRVEIEIPLHERSWFVHGWQLTEDIEGHITAGQVWIDGEEDSTFPSPDWSIEPD